MYEIEWMNEREKRSHRQYILAEKMIYFLPPQYRQTRQELIAQYTITSENQTKFLVKKM